MGWLATLLGERQNGLYREGEAPADPKPSSAGASLSHPCLGQLAKLDRSLTLPSVPRAGRFQQVDFSLPLALRPVQRLERFWSRIKKFPQRNLCGTTSGTRGGITRPYRG